MSYHYINVWKKISPELSAEIIKFWTDEKALPKDAQPTKRVEQVVMIMRDDNNNIVAVSTVFAQIIPRLKQTLYYYRTFCAEQHRRKNTSIDMMKACQQALLEYNQGLDKPEAIGIILEIESKYIHERYPEAFWQQTSFSFIGYSPRNLPLRVYYFPEFKLQPPVRIAQGNKNARAAKKQISIDKSTPN